MKSLMLTLPAVVHTRRDNMRLCILCEHICQLGDRCECCKERLRGSC
jgi:hypothetical protein